MIHAKPEADLYTLKQRNIQINEGLWQAMKLFIAERDNKRALRQLQKGLTPEFHRTSIAEFIREAIEQHLVMQRSREKMIEDGMVQEG